MKKIANMLIDMAALYGYEIEERQMQMFLKSFARVPEEMVLEAGRRYVANHKNTRFPVPPHIMLVDLMPGEPSARDLAVSTAMRIREALAKFGWPSPSKARAHIGETGWRVVAALGGWLHLCENLGGSISETTFQAQCRDAIEAEINLQKAGFDTKLPPIEQAHRGAPAGQIGELVKTLAEAKTLNPEEVK